MNHDEAVATLASERYLLDEMTERERDAFEAHFFECRSCADDVKVGGALRDGAESYFAARRPAAFRWRPMVALPYGAAAALAIAVGYQSLVVIPGLRSGEVPAVASAVVVRPSTRGQEATVVRGPAGAPAVIAVDVVPGNVTGDVDFEMVGPGGKMVTSGRVALPAAGSPLYLVVPPRAPAGEYVLRLKNGPAETSRAEYRFVVK